jgi:hypothetical protein
MKLNDVKRLSAKDVQRPTGPIVGEPRRSSQMTPMKGCEVSMVVNDKSWKGTLSGSHCADELRKMKKLGAESRNFLASHLETADPELSKTLNALRKKKSRK